MAPNKHRPGTPAPVNGTYVLCIASGARTARRYQLEQGDRLPAVGLTSADNDLGFHYVLIEAVEVKAA